MSLQGSAGSTNLNNLNGKISGMSPNAIDPTLSIEGTSADAKATGDAIKKLTGGSTATIKDVEELTAKAQSSASKAQSAANDAQDTANNATSIAKKAQSAANSAENSASNALAAAENCRAKAENASEASDEAMKAASKALNAGKNAQATADSKVSLHADIYNLTVEEWKTIDVNMGDIQLGGSQFLAIDNVLADKEKCYVQVTPQVSYAEMYETNGIRLWEQHDGGLVFRCTTIPDGDVVLDVLVLTQGESTPYREDFAEEAAEVIRDKEYYDNLSDGHFHKIRMNTTLEMPTYALLNDEVAEYAVEDGSDYIKCPKFLCLNFSDSSARAYIYFYNLVDGEYVLNWDVVNTTSSSGVKNYLKASDFPKNVIEIPDNVYMRVAVTNGTLDLYGWDGEMFGMKLSADTGIVSNSGGKYVLNADGSCGLTIPGNAKMIMCKNESLYAIHGMVNGVLTTLDTTKREFYVLPGGYDYYRMRLFIGNDEKVTRSGDISDLVSIVMEHDSGKVSARAKKVLEACKKVCDMKWTPKANVRVNSETDNTFKNGVEYNGIPYSSNWETAHYLGWHVSPHTFANAVNDEKSVFYTEKAVDSNGVEALYYGVVCSAFATMCDGWAYPQTNAGFLYDPMVLKSYSPEPVPGALYSNIVSHCVIPEDVIHMEDEYAVNLYEAVDPLCSRMTRYENLTKTKDASAYEVNYGSGYFDRYGYIVRHLNASGYLTAPYADFDDLSVVGGSARPHKGDKSVYTSEDAAVYINIKGSSATTLYLKYGKAVESIPIDGDLMDVKPFLTEDGIYSVYTNADDTQESFEYHSVEPVTYTITDGKITFSRNDFWYASCNLRGNPLFVDDDGNVASKRCCVPVNKTGDYSAWNEYGARFTSAYAVFYKGEYGAYAVSCTK